MGNLDPLLDDSGPLLDLAVVQEWIQSELDRVHDSDPKSNVQVSYYRKSLLLEPRENQIPRTPVEGPGGANGQGMFAWRKIGTSNSKTLNNALTTDQ